MASYIGCVRVMTETFYDEAGAVTEVIVRQDHLITGQRKSGASGVAGGRSRGRPVDGNRADGGDYRRPA